VEAAQHQAGSLAFFWLLHGWIQDGFAWLTQAVSLSDSSEMKTAAWFEALVGLSYMVGGDRQVTLARLEAELPRGREAADAPTLALALMQVGRLTWMVRHDLEVARAHLEEAVCVAGRAGSEPLQAFIRGHFAGFLYEAGEYELAERLLEQNLRAGGAFESYLSQNKLLLGWVRLARGDPPGAARLLEEVLAEPFASRSPYWSVMALTALSWVGLAQQDVEAAILSATRALAIVREHLGRDMTPGFLGAPLEAFAEIASATGQPVRALQLAAAASAFREKHHIRRSPSERELLSRWMARSRVALGPSASEQHTAAGRALTPEQAIAEALEVETVHRAQAVTP
jgi:tetratricopeptide (TPR) repeat protein